MWSWTTLTAALLLGAGPPSRALDAWGDPLPPGAVARLGSVRLRHDGLRAVAVEPGGETLVTIGEDMHVRRWRVRDGSPVSAVPIREVDAFAHATSFDQAGRVVAARDSDESGRDGFAIIDCARGFVLKRYLVPDGESVLAPRLSPDGLRVAVHHGKALRFLDWKAGKSVGAVGVPHGRATGAWSPDGKRYVACGFDATVILDTASGEAVAKFPASYAVAVSRERVAVLSFIGDFKTAVRFYPTVGGDEVAAFPLGPVRARDLTFSPDGRSLIVATAEETVVLDARTGRLRFRVGECLEGSAFSADGETVFSRRPHQVVAWRLKDGSRLHPFTDSAEGAIQGGFPLHAVSPDGRSLLTRAAGGRPAFVWSLRTGLVTHRPAVTGEATGARFVSPDALLLTGAKHVHRFDLAKGTTEKVWSLDKGMLYGTVCLSRDGAFVSMAWPRNGAELRCFAMGKAEAVQERAMPHNGTAAWADDGRSLLFATEGKATLTRLPGGPTAERDDLAGLAHPRFSADGRLVVSQRLRAKGEAVAVELATGGVAARFASSAWQFAAWECADGRRAVVPGPDAVRVHDLATGEVLQTIRAPACAPKSYAAAPTPGGDRVAVFAANGLIHVYPVADAPSLAANATPKDVAGWWGGLLSPDAKTGMGAVWRLADAPENAVIDLMNKELRAVAPGSSERAKRLIADLDADDFDTRTKAQGALAEMGGDAAPALRAAKARPASVEAFRRVEKLLAALERPTGEALRRARAVQALEMRRSTAALALLRDLAKGPPGADLSREAAASRDRLERQGVR